MTRRSRVCLKCGLEKVVAEFHKSMFGTPQSHCKLCHNALCREGMARTRKTVPGFLEKEALYRRLKYRLEPAYAEKAKARAKRNYWRRKLAAQVELEDRLAHPEPVRPKRVA